MTLAPVANRARGVGTGVAWWVTTTLAWGLYTRLFAEDSSLLASWVSAYTYWYYIPAYVLLPVAFALRWWAPAAVCTVAIAFHLAWVGPMLAGPRVQARTDVRGEVISLVSANLRTDNTDRDGMLDELDELDTDVILVQEYTPRWAELFRERGLDREYPYFVEAPRENARGSAIFSRLPLEGAEMWDMAGTSNTRARLVGTGLWLYSVHPIPPRPHADVQWAALIAEVERVREPLLVAGDYNVTPFNQWYERLEDTGMRSCHDDLGQERNTTWPNGVYPLPPIRLDNVFVSSDVACVSLREGRGAGSDHEPVIVEVALDP